jgi:hypothetical protein
MLEIELIEPTPNESSKDVERLGMVGFGAIYNTVIVLK